jgi:ATP-dependent exoDNAse (exonuclease V) beta subunit
MFSDLTWKLARELPSLLHGDLPPIQHRLDVGIEHLLLDEFQDTSPSQWQVLEPFADKVTATEPESLFVVGDMKQAIYGWRGGNAALFADVEDRYGIPAQDLATSYRSVPAVVDLVNAVFGTIGSNQGFPEDPADRIAARRFQEGFVTHESAGHLQARAGYVELRTSTAPPAEEELDLDEQVQEWPEVPASALIEEPEDLDPPTSHEEYVAQRVAQLHAAHPTGSIAVLVRTNFMAARLLHEFRRESGGHPTLPVSGEGGSPLTGSPVVAAVLSAFSLADHPGDSAAAYHVATTPLGPVLDLTPDISAETIARVSHQIRRALADRGYTSLLGEWVPQLAPGCDDEAVRQLQQLLQLSYQFEATVRPGDFVEFVEATAVEQTATAAIRVMTIHAAKGLEFDTVVLPELDNRPQYLYPVLLQRERESGPPAAIMPFASESIRRLSPQLQTAYEQERARRRYEDVCVLYVALTRARHAVHMILLPKPERKTARMYADIMRHALAPGVALTEEGDQLLYESGSSTWYVGSMPPETDTEFPSTQSLDIQLAPLPDTHTRRAWPSTSPSAHEGDGSLRGADLLRSTGGDARLRGLVFHDWFECVGFVDEAGWIPDDEQLRSKACHHYPSLGDVGLEGWIRQFHEALQKPPIRAALQRDGARELWRERTFALREDGRLLQGRFDRVAIWDDRALLLDFKTDASSTEAQNHYRPQVDSYRRALSALLGLSIEQVHAKLFFVATGDVVDM